MKTLYHKSGFALVTVLILLVGLSLAGAGLTYKLIYETRLVDSWQQREVANTASETGLESAKRWLESELDKGTVFSEGSVIKADEGSPNYCLKGFKVDEITSLKTETALLSTELGDENFKNYKYEYYIEDITKDYNTYLGIIKPKTYIYILFSDEPYHTGYPAGSILVLDALTGDNSDKHPIINTYSQSKVFGKTGYALPGGPTSRFVIDGDVIYVHTGEYIYGIDKYTGVEKNIKIHVKAGDIGPEGWDTGTGEPGSYFVVDEKYLYHRLVVGGRGYYVNIYDKITGENSSEHPTMEYSYHGKNLKVSGYSISVGGVEKRSAFAIDGNYLYDFSLSDEIRVYNKIDGSKSLDHQTNYINGEVSKNIFNIENFYSFGRPDVIDGKFIYFEAANSGSSGKTGYIPVFNKMTGQPSDMHTSLSKFQSFITNDNKKFSNKTGLKIDIASGDVYRTNLYIHNNYLYKLRRDMELGNSAYNRDSRGFYPIIISYYDKYGGGKIGEFVFEGGFNAGTTQIIVEGGSEGNVVETSYFRIRSCGFGLNNSVSRVETVYSYASDTKSLAQISWKELF